MERRRFLILAVGEEHEDCLLVEQFIGEEGLRCGFEMERYPLKSGTELLDYLDRCVSEGISRRPVCDMIFFHLDVPASGEREAFSDVKAHPLCRRVPILAFVETADQPGRVDCYHCGGNAFSRKPRDHETLKRIARTLVHHWLCSDHQPGAPPFSCMGYG